ncbi:unnamed protein product [Amoebophrya sp. A25]|nr:unnamed protein product [Amoebophrya sp. A25]|eukprot:GSA25T00021123001.1
MNPLLPLMPASIIISGTGSCDYLLLCGQKSTLDRMRYLKNENKSKLSRKFLRVTISV